MGIAMHQLHLWPGQLQSGSSMTNDKGRPVHRIARMTPGFRANVREPMSCIRSVPLIFIGQKPWLTLAPACRRLAPAVSIAQQAKTTNWLVTDLWLCCITKTPARRGRLCVHITVVQGWLSQTVLIKWKSKIQALVPWKPLCLTHDTWLAHDLTNRKFRLRTIKYPESGVGKDIRHLAKAYCNQSWRAGSACFCWVTWHGSFIQCPHSTKSGVY